MDADDLLQQARAEERRSRKVFDLATHGRPFATATQLAEYLDCDRRTIVRMITGGSLPGVKVGRCWKVPTDAAREMFHVKAAL